MKNKNLYFSFQSSQDFGPDVRELESFQRKYKKDFKTRELYEGDELLQEYRLRGWKHPRYSKIVSFIVAFEVEGKLRVRFFIGNEKDLIQEFVNILKKSLDYTVVTFDSQIVLPYLGIRMTRNGFINPPHIGISYKGLRPWDLKCLDLQQYYDGAGNYKSTIKDIAEDLSLECNDIIEFEDEFSYYNSGDFEALKKSAIQKIKVMSDSLNILKGIKPLEMVLVEEKVQDVVEEAPKNILESIGLLKTLTPELTDQLKGILKKRMSKKDKELAYDLVKASLCEIDPNFGAIRNIKVVEEIVEELKREVDGK